MLFISGRLDELVPPEMMDTLYDSAVKAEFKDMVHIEFGGHNSAWQSGGDKYTRSIKQFMD